MDLPLFMLFQVLCSLFVISHGYSVKSLLFIKFTMLLLWDLKDKIDELAKISKNKNIRDLYFSCGSTAQFWALAASMKLSVSFQLLDLGQSAGLLGWVISSSQGIC
jgi:hypothetical protein